jgi:V/A-type H+-transporting ATPase subunit C
VSAPRHPYLNARVAILAGRLWPLSQLEELLGLPVESQPVESGSQAQLEDILAGHLVSPQEAEHTLLHGLLDDFMILARPLTGLDRDFLVFWLRKYEIANIKSIIRGKMAGMPVDEIRKELADLHSFATLPIDSLLRTEDVAELLRQLEVSTPYTEAARQGRLVYEKKRELFMLEATIDHRYMAGFLRRAKSVHESDRAELNSLASQVAERFNLVWLLRYRFTYGLSPAETYYLLLSQASNYLIKQDLGGLAQMNSVEEVIAKLPAPLQERLSEKRGITAIEQTLEEVVRETARRVVHVSRSALAKSFAYLILRECQMNRIVAIVKGRRLKFKPEWIRDGASLNA